LTIINKRIPRRTVRTKKFIFPFREEPFRTANQKTDPHERPRYRLSSRTRKSSRTFFVLPVLMIIVICASCKKEAAPKFKYENLLEQKWTLKSTTTRSFAYGYPAVPWLTAQISSGETDQFNGNGTYYVDYPFVTEFRYDFKFLSDTTVITMNQDPPAGTTVIPDAPDTFFIHYIDHSLLVTYSRTFYLSPTYSTLAEKIDTLTR
jgi:hypothetical protein